MDGVRGTVLLLEVCASLQCQREAVMHLAVAGGVGGVLSTTLSHLFIQLITYSAVHLVNEPNKSILFYAKYHFVFIMLELRLLVERNHWTRSYCRNPTSLLAAGASSNIKSQ